MQGRTMQLLHPYWKGLGLTFLSILLAKSPAVLASGKAFNTLVVVNTNSADSVELGDYYAAAHGIPSHHICSIGINTNRTSLFPSEFQSLVRTPITNHIAAENLDGQIDFIVLCQEIPTRINNRQGLSASLFYGSRYSGTSGCDPPTSFTTNAYYRAEQAFRFGDAWNATNGFISFHLIASDLPVAKLITDRGVAAQSSFPPASINLYLYGDQLRGVREQLFANAQFAFTALPGLPASCLVPPRYELMSGETNLIGYHDGFANVQATNFCNLRTNTTWLPGAYADHLTSAGGMITNLANATGQSTILDWMDIGATASYGTVEEPCNYLEKFPTPLMGFFYARGFTIGEAYSMAIKAPYQGLFAGDPLAAPFAAPPSLSVTSQIPYQIVTGTVPVQVSATAHSNGVPAASIDFYLDDRFQTNLITLGPTPSNRLSIAVGTRTNTIIVATNYSLFGAISTLADAVNADSTQTVAATATGDRLELIYKQYTHDGDNLPVTASVAQGEASALTLDIGLAATNLHPSIYPARKIIYLEDNPRDAGANAGDTLTCIITLTNDITVTNILVASQGESRYSILERLLTLINTNTLLMATNGVYYDRLAKPGFVKWSGGFFARTPGPDGHPIRIDYSISAVSNNSGLKTNHNFLSIMDDYSEDLRPHASVLFHITPTNGVLEAGISLDTTTLSDGVHTLDFVARDGSAVAAASRLTLPLVICNSSPQLSLLGTNGVTVTNGEPASLANGTDFGPVDQGKALTNTYSLHNNGTAALAITGWTTNGTGTDAFQIIGIPSAIQIGGVSNFTVIFTPSGDKIFDASLDIDSDAILDQTNLLFAGTGVVYRLTVASEHGTPTPAVGIHTNLGGAILTNSITIPTPDGGTQLVSTGWAMTGHNPTSGSTTNFEMTVTNNASLTWLWTTNYWLETTTSLHGSVNIGDDWQPGGVTTQITATANLYYHFTQWTGEASGNDNPLSLLMDGPKSIQANFTENLAANDTPEWWLAQHGWTNNFDAAATNDVDEDDYSTWQEYIADTDPTNANSFFPPLEVTGSATNLLFEIDPTSTGRHYYVDVGTPITNAGWSNISNTPGSGSAWGPEFTPPGPGIFFYRSRVTLPL